MIETIIAWKGFRQISVTSRQVQGILLIEFSNFFFAELIRVSRKHSRSHRQLVNVKYGIDWVVAHEVQHASLGHFELQEGLPIFHLIARTAVSELRDLNLCQFSWNKAARCLELQADHNALELMLGAYSSERWNELREKIASISVVMVLIELADVENNIRHSTHPKAATRIFQLLGHVTEMWSIPAHTKAKKEGDKVIYPDDLPSEEEKQAFSREVILPAYWDAVALAKSADARGIIADLGSPEDFFADIARAKLGQWRDLATVGAKEWGELKDVNDQILPLLPINQVTT